MKNAILHNLPIGNHCAIKILFSVAGIEAYQAAVGSMPNHYASLTITANVNMEEVYNALCSGYDFEWSTYKEMVNKFPLVEVLMGNARMTSIVIARLTTWYECLPKEYWDENKIIKKVIKGFIESNGLDEIADRPYLSEKNQTITAEKQAAIGAKAFVVHLFQEERGCKDGFNFGVEFSNHNPEKGDVTKLVTSMSHLM